MSLLGRGDLCEAMARERLDERLVVTPLLDPAQVGRGSIDLRLGTEFLLLRRTIRPGLDPDADDEPAFHEMQERVVVPMGGKLWLHPRHFVLAATLEFLALPDDLGAYVMGRSSWGRLGLIVATAVFVHPGYRGCLTLELVNDGDSPLALQPGIRIAQLVVHRLATPAPRLPEEGDKYQAPVRPQPSRLSSEDKEFRNLKEVGLRLRSRLG